jgi:hypothetical protein
MPNRGAAAVAESRDLPKRTENVRQRFLLMKEAAHTIYRSCEKPQEKVGLSGALYTLYRICSERMLSLRRAMESLIDGGPTRKVRGDLRKNLAEVHSRVYYGLGGVQALSEAVAEQHNCPLVPTAAMLCREHEHMANMLYTMREDVETVVNIIDGQLPGVSSVEASPKGGGEPRPSSSGEEDPSSEEPPQARTRLTLAELSGVLGVEEKALLDAALRGDEVKGYAVFAWLRRDQKERGRSSFDVPHEVLRERGAEALID